MGFFSVGDKVEVNSALYEYKNMSVKKWVYFFTNCNPNDLLKNGISKRHKNDSSTFTTSSSVYDNTFCMHQRAPLRNKFIAYRTGESLDLPVHGI